MRVVIILFQPLFHRRDDARVPIAREKRLLDDVFSSLKRSNKRRVKERRTCTRTKPNKRVTIGRDRRPKALSIFSCFGQKSHFEFFCPFSRFERTLEELFRRERDFKIGAKPNEERGRAMRRAFGRQNASHQPVLVLMLLILIV